MKYKCSECRGVFDFEEEPTECPNGCQDAVLSPVSGGGSLLRYILMGIGGVVLLVVFIWLLRGCGGGGEKGVTAKWGYNKEKLVLTVTIEGDKAFDKNGHCKYNVRVEPPLGKEISVPITKGQAMKSFKGYAPGEYRASLEWKKRTEKEPVLRNGDWKFTIPKEPEKPRCLKVSVLSSDYKTQKYMVKVITDTTLVPATNTEYSLDGVTYQLSPEFKDVIAEQHYTFYARTRANNKNLVDTIGKTFPHIKKSDPDDATISSWLNQVASSGSQRAYDAFYNELVRGRKTIDVRVIHGGKTVDVEALEKVVNAYGLLDYVNMTRTPVSIKTKRENGRVVEIIVR